MQKSPGMKAPPCSPPSALDTTCVDPASSAQTASDGLEYQRRTNGINGRKDGVARRRSNMRARDT